MEDLRCDICEKTIGPDDTFVSLDRLGPDRYVTTLVKKLQPGDIIQGDVFCHADCLMNSGAKRLGNVGIHNG